MPFGNDRWGGPRPAPYKPDAVDSDNDGLVQEGTVWERPGGTRFVDRAGRLITQTLDNVPDGAFIVNERGERVDYTPKRQSPGPTEMGTPYIGDLNDFTTPDPIGAPIGETIGESIGAIHGTIGDDDDDDLFDVEPDFDEVLMARYPGSRIDLYESSSTDSEGNRIAVLSRIVVPEDDRDQGTGTEIMSDIVAWAEENGNTIALSPTGDYGGDPDRLAEFYRRFGFVDNRGKDKDFAISETMYRLPNEAATEEELIERAFVTWSEDSDDIRETINSIVAGETPRRRDLEPEARALMSALDEAPDSEVELMRGTRMSEADLPKVGDEHDMGYASLTNSRRSADFYAGVDDPLRSGEARVVYSIGEGDIRVHANLDNWSSDQEHLAPPTRMRVESVEFDEDKQVYNVRLGKLDDGPPAVVDGEGQYVSDILAPDLANSFSTRDLDDRRTVLDARDRIQYNRQALKNYTTAGSVSSTINRRLRGENVEVGPKTEAAVQATEGPLLEAIEASKVDADFTTYRGLFAQNLLPDVSDGDYEGALRDLVGETISDPAILSTSLSPTTAVGFASRRREGQDAPNSPGVMFRLNVPEGSSALSMEGHSLHRAENEVLLPPGTHMEIVGVTRIDNPGSGDWYGNQAFVVDARVVPDSVGASQPVSVQADPKSSTVDAAISEAIKAPKEARKPRKYNVAPSPYRGGVEDIARRAETWGEFQELLRDETVIAFDYETTGFPDANGNGDNRPVEIAAVKMEGGEVVDRFQTFINPGTPRDQWADFSRENLVDDDGNPLTDEFLATQPDMAEAHRQLVEFMGERPILMAHNLSFDQEVLDRTLQEEGIDFTPLGGLDTLQLARDILEGEDDVPSRRLRDLADHYGIELDNWHKADADTEATAALLDALIEDADGRGVSTDLLDPEVQTGRATDRRRVRDERYAKQLSEYQEAIKAREQAVSAARDAGYVSSSKADIRDKWEADIRDGKYGEIPDDWDPDNLQKVLDDTLGEPASEGFARDVDVALVELADEEGIGSIAERYGLPQFTSRTKEDTKGEFINAGKIVAIDEGVFTKDRSDGTNPADYVPWSKKDTYAFVDETSDADAGRMNLQVGDGAKATLRHELGHFVEEELSQEDRDEWFRLWSSLMTDLDLKTGRNEERQYEQWRRPDMRGKWVSAYAAVNSNEGFAETLSLVANPRYPGADSFEPELRPMLEFMEGIVYGR